MELLVKPKKGSAMETLGGPQRPHTGSQAVNTQSNIWVLGLAGLRV